MALASDNVIHFPLINSTLGFGDRAVSYLHHILDDELRLVDWYWRYTVGVTDRDIFEFNARGDVTDVYNIQSYTQHTPIEVVVSDWIVCVLTSGRTLLYFQSHVQGEIDTQLISIARTNMGYIMGLQQDGTVVHIDTANNGTLEITPFGEALDLDGEMFRLVMSTDRAMAWNESRIIEHNGSQTVVVEQVPPHGPNIRKCVGWDTSNLAVLYTDGELYEIHISTGEKRYIGSGYANVCVIDMYLFTHTLILVGVLEDGTSEYVGRRARIAMPTGVTVVSGDMYIPRGMRIKSAVN